METIATASKICIRLREPKDSYIEGDKARPAKGGSGMLMENARLAYSIDTTPLGRLVLVPYENIVYITLEE